MLQRSICAALLLILGTFATSSAADVDGKKIAVLIEQLGSGKFQERSGAQKELEAIGAAALEQLRKATEVGDLETRKRAGDLVRKLEEKALTADLLTPKRLRFTVKDLSANDAASELTRLTGYGIQILLGDQTPLAGKRINLDTGTVTFWEAFDRLCAAAGLMELVPGIHNAPGRYIDQIKDGTSWTVNLTRMNQSGIVVVSGTPRNEHISHAGSVRTRVYAAPAGKSGEYQFTLETSAEPRLQGFGIVGNPTFEKVVDDQGQTLTPHADANQETNPAIAGVNGRLLRPYGVLPPAARRQLLLRFKAGEKPAQTLTRLAGNFTAQVQSALEPVMILTDVVQAAGATAKGKYGGLLRLSSIAKLDNGDYKLTIYVEMPPGPNSAVFGNGVIQMQQMQVQVGGFGGPISSLAMPPGLPELVDAEGKKYRVVQIPSRRMSINNGVSTQEFTIIFRAQDNQGAPDRLLVQGSRAVNITVPFAFQNVSVE